MTPQLQFQLLRTQDIDVELAQLLSRWDGTREEHLAFVEWALEVAAAAEETAQQDPGLAVEHLRRERDLAHGLLAEQACRAGVIDLQLVSRRMFFDWLRVELQPRSMAA